MHLSTLLSMAADGFGDRIAIGSKNGGLTYNELEDRSARAARWLNDQLIDDTPPATAVLVDTNSEAVPILLFGSARANVPFAPLNYRLSDDRLQSLLDRTAPSIAVVADDVRARVGEIDGVKFVETHDFLVSSKSWEPTTSNEALDPDQIAVLLFTSGTTGDPKAAVLRHHHLASYVISTVDFMGADKGEATLVSVPPYHIAGISSILSSTFAGRRIAYLESFTADAWIDTARKESITHAMVVPTMLGRILDSLEKDDEPLPHLRHLSYGGGRMPVAVIERAMALLPRVGFVNAYGLTETSSTISVLSHADHVEAFKSDDPLIRQRLGSVGRPLPGVDLTIRDTEGSALEPGAEGEVWVRGEQIAGEYLDSPGSHGTNWFATRDGGFLDDEGFLYLTGRLDDVIVRGAENISPVEVEDVLAEHPAVAQVAVVGIPHVDWGEQVVAAVVLREGASASEAELQASVREKLRSSRTPEHIQFRPDLPYNETGKLLRRVLRSELSTYFGR